MKHLIYIVLLVFLLVSCNKKPVDCCVNIDTRIDLKLVDENGNDLLDTINGIQSSNIITYYKRDGEWIEYFEGNLDYPRGYFTYKNDSDMYLALFPSEYFYDDNYSETKLLYSENDSAIVKSQFYLSHNNIMCIRVWYNDSLVWQNSDGLRIIEITKQ